MSQATEPGSAGGDGGARREQRDDRGLPRPALLDGLPQQLLLGGEEDLADVVGVPVDAQVVTKVVVDTADEADDVRPQLRGQQPEAAQAGLLDEVEEQVGLAQASAGAQLPLAAEGGGAPDQLQLGARALQGAPSLLRGAQ